VRRLAAALLALAALAGCQLRTEIGITVDDDGSGVVSVAVGLDDEALERAGEVQVDDLEATGWTITGPDLEDDGLHWYRATKPFGTPEEAGTVMAEIAEGSPFQDFAVTRDKSFGTTRYRFRGTVDFTDGLEQLGDDDLAAELDGEPLGEDIEALEERLGESIDRLVQVEIAVRLPGDVSSNAPTRASNGAKWTPGIGDGPVQLEASSTDRDLTVWGLAALAVLCALAAIVIVVRRIVRHRRPKER
jgi:hypothetical protein